MTGLTLGESYRFKVFAKNGCGRTADSTELFVRLAFVPGEMEAVKTTTKPDDACNVELSWIVPDDGGSPIQKVTVEVRSK